jgi:hypothetical protein
MKSSIFPAIFFLLFMLPATEPSLHAQGKKKQTLRQSQSAKAADQYATSRDEFIKLTKEYKESLAQLLALYEKDVLKAEDRLAQAKELYTEGLISKRDLEARAREVESAKAKITETRQQMVDADERVAETLVESQTIEQMAKAPPLQPGRLTQTTAYIRYGGALGGWSLSAGAMKVQSFFLQKFGRQLPISAFGQSAIHDRWGLDHRNAMDVGLDPESPEGQALMAFLRSNGIPFTAFRYAIPGTATGPHIHVGRPSHRTSPVIQ